MTKSIKRFTASFLAAMLVLTTLCTTAFAAGTIKATVSGDFGNQKVSYSYSIDSNPIASKIGFVTTTEASTYTLTFSPASGSGATIYFYDFANKPITKLTVPQSVVGMPSSFITSVHLGKDMIVYVTVESNLPSSKAIGWFTIEGVVTTLSPTVVPV